MEFDSQGFRTCEPSRHEGVKERFIQRFHYKHEAVKGLFRFMNELQHYQVHNPDTSVEKAEKAESDVSSEHFEDANMGALIQLMTSEKK